jgi:hypothetical protein
VRIGRWDRYGYNPYNVRGCVKTITRGTDNVRTESLLHFLAYNMKRVINIKGTREIVALLGVSTPLRPNLRYLQRFLVAALGIGAGIFA